MVVDSMDSALLDIFAIVAAAASNSPIVAVAALAVLVLSAGLILTYAW